LCFKRIGVDRKREILLSETCEEGSRERRWKKVGER